MPTDRKLDGVDLLPYVQGRNNEIPHKTLFWREGHHQTVLHNGWKLIKNILKYGQTLMKKKIHQRIMRNLKMKKINLKNILKKTFNKKS